MWCHPCRSESPPCKGPPPSRSASSLSKPPIRPARGKYSNQDRNSTAFDGPSAGYLRKMSCRGPICMQLGVLTALNGAMPQSKSNRRTPCAYTSASWPTSTISSKDSSHFRTCNRGPHQNDNEKKSLLFSQGWHVCTKSLIYQNAPLHDLDPHALRHAVPCAPAQDMKSWRDHLDAFELVTCRNSV